MLKFNKFNIKKNHYIIFIVLIVFTIHTNFFHNFYLTLIKTYEERLEKYYGYCDKQGYGFIKKYNLVYNLKDNAQIINKSDYPYSGFFINQFKEPENFKYIVILNSEIVLDNNNILEQEYNCYILKND